jgi:hypothetical protein
MAKAGSARLISRDAAANTSPWAGLLLPVPATISRARDDLLGSPEIVHRRYLTAAQYRELSTGVQRLQAMPQEWHLIFLNCNDFVGETAEMLHLRRPPSMVLPITYVALLSALNP